MKTKLLVTFVTFLAQNALSLELQGTQFERVAHDFGLDPVLVYSIALAESAYGRGDNTIAPWPWTLRSSDGAFYAENKEQAVVRLESLIAEQGVKAKVDIGIMQINLYWNGHRVADPTTLLDPFVNLVKGAEILSETIQSSPGDLELGIGRYHHWVNEATARSYGRRVLSIYNQLSDMEHSNVTYTF